MKVNLEPKALFAPQPALVIGTYNNDGTANAMVAAWGCISGYTQVCICIDAGHKTAENVKREKSFTVQMTTAEFVANCDYLGMNSGNDVSNKLDKSGLKYSKSAKINAPVIDDLKVTLECVLNRYEEDTELCFGDIVNIVVDDSVLTNGKVDFEKWKPVALDGEMGLYRILGESVGNAFSEGKKII